MNRKPPKIDLIKQKDNTRTKKFWIFDSIVPNDRDEPNPHLLVKRLIYVEFSNINKSKSKTGKI